MGFLKNYLGVLVAIDIYLYNEGAPAITCHSDCYLESKRYQRVWIICQ